MERKNSFKSQDSSRSSRDSLPWFQTVLLCHDLLHNRSCDDREGRRRGKNDQPEEDNERSSKRRRRRIWRFVIWSLASILVAYYYNRRKKQLAAPGYTRLSLDWTWLRRIRGWEAVVIPTVKMWLQQMVEQPPYRAASKVPISALWTALRSRDMREAVWLESERGIAFRSRASDGDETWKRVAQLPEAAKSQLMHLLQERASDGLKVSTEPPSLATRMATPALTALPFVYLGLMWFVLRDVYSNGNQVKTTPKPTSTTTFRDVAGLCEAKREVQEVVDVLLRPLRYQRLGITTPRAILLYGPPGSGKTLMARAVAGEAKVDQFLVCSGSDFVDTYVGRGASRIRSLFARARVNAGFWRLRTPSNTTTIIFMDEIDALAKTRGSGLTSNDERDQTLNQLLVELDGFATSHRTDVLFICATNRRDVLDPALVRRMDRQIQVGLPASAEERLEILNLHARRIESTCDLEEAAQRTSGASGSQLRTIVNEAALLALRDGSQVVQEHHFLQAADKICRQQLRTTTPTYYRNALLPSFP